MLTKNSFLLTHLFFILPNTEKHGKLSLHKVFHRNKRSVERKMLEQQTILQKNLRTINVVSDFW